MSAQCIYDAHKERVFCLLSRREFVIRHEARMLFLRRVFRRAVFPAGRLFLFQPFLVAVRRFAVWIRQMEVHAVDGARPLPFGRFFPCWLRVVTERLAVGAVGFVADFCDFSWCHTMCSNKALHLTAAPLGSSDAAGFTMVSGLSKSRSAAVGELGRSLLLKLFSLFNCLTA